MPVVEERRGKPWQVNVQGVTAEGRAHQIPNLRLLRGRWIPNKNVGILGRAGRASQGITDDPVDGCLGKKRDAFSWWS